MAEDPTRSSTRISRSLECRQPDLERRRRRRGACLGPGPAGMSAGAGELDEAAGARQGWLRAVSAVSEACSPCVVLMIGSDAH